MSISARNTALGTSDITFAWWQALGLTTSGIPGQAAGDARTAAVIRGVLAEHPPLAFAGGVERGGSAQAPHHNTAVEGASAPQGTLTPDELAAKLRAAVDAAALEVREAERAADEAERALGRERAEAALAAPDSAANIETGRWAGFTRGEAVAWSWHLFQYEHRGIAHPGSQLRAEAIRSLAEGGLPEVFDYPELARKLADSGLTPSAYREHHEALGARPRPTVGPLTR